MAVISKDADGASTPAAPAGQVPGVPNNAPGGNANNNNKASTW